MTTLAIIAAGFAGVYLFGAALFGWKWPWYVVLVIVAMFSD